MIWRKFDVAGMTVGKRSRGNRDNRRAKGSGLGKSAERTESGNIDEHVSGIDCRLVPAAIGAWVCAGMAVGWGRGAIIGTAAIFSVVSITGWVARRGGIMFAFGILTLVAVRIAVAPPVLQRFGSSAASGPGSHIAESLRAGLKASAQGLPRDAAMLLPGVSVGDTSGVDPSLKTAMNAASLSHLTAVSGAHVAIVVASVLLVLGYLRVPRKIQLAATALVITGFVILVGPGATVLRSAIMGLAMVAGMLIGRRRAALPALCSAVILLMVIDPAMSRQYGFALSVAATAGLILLAPRCEKNLGRVMPESVAKAISVPATAQAVCGPIIVLFAPQVSVVGIFANLAAAPAVPIATIGGLLACVARPVFGPLADVPLWIGGVGAEWIADVARWSTSLGWSQLPWPVGLGGAGLLVVVEAVIAVFASMVLRARPGRAIGLAAAGVCVLAIASVPPVWKNVHRHLSSPWPGGAWSIAICDVGQGSASVVATSPHHGVLIDAGPQAGGVGDCLDRLDVTTIDSLVVSHFHADHVDGLAEAIHGRRVIRAVLPVACGLRQAEAKVREELGKDVKITQLTSENGSSDFTFGDAGFRVIPSPEDVRCPVEVDGRAARDSDGSPINDASSTVLVQAGHIKALFPGDLEKAGQADLRRALAGSVMPGSGAPIFPLDVIAIAHHGSAKQDPDLAALLAPRVATASEGSHNVYHHPSIKTVDLYRQVGASVIRTDTNSSLAFAKQGDDLIVTSKKGTVAHEGE